MTLKTMARLACAVSGPELLGPSLGVDWTVEGASTCTASCAAQPFETSLTWPAQCRNGEAGALVICTTVGNQEP